jgi:Protein of unknown function (DUF3592)
VRERSRRSPALWGVVALLTGGLALASLAMPLQGLWATDWVRTRGQVVTASVSVGSTIVHGASVEKCSPVVEYRYEVDGVTYEGDQIAPVAPGGWRYRRQAEEYLEEHGFQAGAEVEVLYDPADPSQALLLRTTPARNLFAHLFLSVCLGFGAVEAARRGLGYGPLVR